MVEDYTKKTNPWPIVETKIGEPGFQILALNSEHLMRRIICEYDVEYNDNNNISKLHLIKLYNDDIGKGYGVDKYVLLRVGPFLDLYNTMSKLHYNKGDIQSALIACETCNSKLSGYGITFYYYSKLLYNLNNRIEECRDAARICLRVSLSTIGITYNDIIDIAILGQIATKVLTNDEIILKLKDLYNLMRSVEANEDNLVKNCYRRSECYIRLYCIK